MIQTEFERFRDVMRGMGRVFKEEVDAVILDAYWLALRSWSLADFEKAAAHLMANCQFMPRPNDFTKLKKAGKPTAGEAWAIALANCTCWRAGKTPGGLIDRAASAIGGYRSIAMADIETALPHLERRFKTAYEELDEVEEVREALPNIADRPMLENRTHTNGELALLLKGIKH